MDTQQVLDLMVRMLGFSEEDKQRIGLAQQGASGKGVVRGVFSLPGRLVGGILGGSSTGIPSNAASDNQVNPLRAYNLKFIAYAIQIFMRFW